MKSRLYTGRSAFPLQGWVGLSLIAVFWPLNWMLPGLRTSYLFFPLWLGYILVVDALLARRSGRSLWTSSRRDFVMLFVVSAPAWWLFEFINRRTGNWEYLGGEHFSGFEYFLLSTISFSTVMPAVFGTAELARTFGWIDRIRAGPRIPARRSVHAGMFVLGGLMLGLTWAWPKYFYPWVWGSVFLMVDPINAILGRPSFLEPLERGDWRPALSLSLGALICGFFWELWNFYSFPKWVYHTPGAEFLYVFEMPLLGYLGYLPFAWELEVLRNLLWPRGPRPCLHWAGSSRVADESKF